MKIDVSGDDLRKQLTHIRKNLNKGPKSTLLIEVYDDEVLLVYRNIELPVKLVNATGAGHRLMAVYKIINYTLLQRLTEKYEDFQSYTLDLFPDCIKMGVGNSQFNIDACQQK